MTSQKNKFFKKLENLGIQVNIDTQLRSDGKRLENYVFTANNESFKIIESIIDRDFGQSHYYKATGTINKQGNPEYKYVRLTDKLYYERWLDYIFINLKIQQIVN